MDQKAEAVTTEALMQQSLLLLLVGVHEVCPHHLLVCCHRRSRGCRNRHPCMECMATALILPCPG